MPKRARPGRRAAIEAELGDVEFRTLGVLCARLGLSLSGWQGTPLGPVFETAAVIGLRDRLQADGLAAEAALEEAAARLGVSAETVRTRLQRWYRDSRRPPPADCHNEPCAPPARAVAFERKEGRWPA